MLSSINISEKKYHKKTPTKFVLVLIPTLTLLIGFGLGLITGRGEFDASAQMYGTMAAVLLPTLSLLVIAYAKYFKDLDRL